MFRTARATTFEYSSLPAWTPPGHAGALTVFAATGENPINYIVHHMNLDPGDLGVGDQLQNLRAVRDGTRVFSAYELQDSTRIWIITAKCVLVDAIATRGLLSPLYARPDSLEARQ